jgi:hypothetical protein
LKRYETVGTNPFMSMPTTPETRRATSKGTGRILLVRHGPGRGPHIRLSAFRAGVYDPLLADLAARYTDLRSAIDVWETGTKPPNLESTAAIVFILCDPLRELYPACYAEAEDLARRAQELHIRLVNPPSALSNSIKSRQAGLLAEAGVPTARHWPFASLAEFREILDHVPFPAFVRADLLHAQSQMFFCRTREEALGIPAGRIALPGCLAEFIDTREGFRQTAPDSPFAKYYHKKRAFVFGEHVVNNHIFFGAHPIVGSKSSTFGHYQSLNPIRRMIQNARCRPHVELDYQFFRREPEQVEMLRRTARALDLEFVAVDYSSKADGSIVVWEANPHFSLYLWPFEILPRLRRIPERHRRFHDVIQSFFRELQQGAL